MWLKRRSIIIAATAVIALTGIAVTLNARTKEAAPPPVTMRQNAGQVYGLGTVEAKTLSRLSFEVSGSLAELAVDQGDKIQAGQILAKLDDRQQQAKVAQAQAAVRQAQAGLEQALSRLDRTKTLHVQRNSVNERRQALARRGTVSVEAAEEALANSSTANADVKVAQSDIEAARGGVDAARALLQLEQAILGKYVLTAPYDGIVVSRALELGTTATPGAIVFTIADPVSVWVQAYIDEALAGKLRIGQKTEINLRSQPEQRHYGRIIRLDMENDRVSEERLVHVTFEQQLSPFFLGEQAEILVDTAGETK
ncbi:MAG: efflux RND transporter periplasmic adaptor subunit [Rhodospirillales bacterium]|jgi:HlyD family secretion protein|nr:efflux RND transporter periplasmic adaptor subunit [Rhodospirillales bacterium]